MTLGALLVIVGTIMAIVDCFIGGSLGTYRGRAGLLHLGVILIGVGVLIGGATLQT